jgi:hypothetical protein
MSGLTEENKRPSWELLVECEYRLGAISTLVDQAVRGVTEDDQHWCANDFFVRNIKPLMSMLVGDDRGYPVEEAHDPDQKPEFRTAGDFLSDSHVAYLRPATTAYERMLRTSEAYDTALTHVYSKLPDCRACSCIG